MVVEKNILEKTKTSPSAKLNFAAGDVFLILALGLASGDLQYTP